MLQSGYRDLGEIILPTWQGRQMYMHTFDLAAPKMAAGFEDYEEPVRLLCARVGCFTGEAHLTVDEKIVQPGGSQRRPGAHVDGCFVKAANSWYPKPAWLHHCNELPVARMPVIVASDVPGCRVYIGEFDAQPHVAVDKNDPVPNGDLEHIREQLGVGHLLPANSGYFLSPDCVHESICFTAPTKRVFMRIAMPVGSY